MFVPYDGTPLIGRFAISSTFQSCYRTLGVSLKSSLRSNRIEFLRNSLLFKLARRVCSIMFATQTIHETEGFNSCRRQFMTVLPSIHCLLNSNLLHNYAHYTIMETTSFHLYSCFLRSGYFLHPRKVTLQLLPLLFLPMLYCYPL